MDLMSVPAGEGIGFNYSINYEWYGINGEVQINNSVRIFWTDTESRAVCELIGIDEINHRRSARFLFDYEAASTYSQPPKLPGLDVFFRSLVQILAFVSVSAWVSKVGGNRRVTKGYKVTKYLLPPPVKEAPPPVVELPHNKAAVLAKRRWVSAVPNLVPRRSPTKERTPPLDEREDECEANLSESGGENSNVQWDPLETSERLIPSQPTTPNSFSSWMGTPDSSRVKTLTISSQGLHMKEEVTASQRHLRRKS